MKFRLRQMEVFRAVMMTGSISGASKLLFTSQPAVSRIISHTENTLGLTLFNRVKGKLVPTPEGEALYREVDEFYQRALRVDEFARGLVQGPTGTLNVSASPSLAHGLMARAITRFTYRYPKIRVNFRTTLLNNMAEEVLSHKVDLAVSLHPLEHRNLSVEPLMQGRMVCVVPLVHELTQFVSVTLADVARFTLITHDPGVTFGQLVTAAFRRASVDLSARIDVHETDVACALVRAGAGIAIVDEFTVDGLGWPDLKAIPMVDEIKLTPSIVRSVFDARRTHAEKFVEVLKSQSFSENRLDSFQRCA